MTTVKKADVTSGQLSATLRALGFALSEGKNALGFPYLWFENPGGGAVVLLRADSPEERLNAADPLSAETTLEGRGVASRETFHRLLREAVPQNAQVA